MERVEDIRERLEYAIDDLSKEQGIAVTLKYIDQASQKAVGIYVHDEKSYPGVASGRYPLRIMTLYEKDVERFAHLDIDDKTPAERSVERLASYFAAQIEAHFLLFLKLEPQYVPYQSLAIDKTIEGKIYRELYIRSKEVVDLLPQGAFNETVVRDALGRVPLYQRERVQRMSRMVPRDWDKSYRGLVYK